MEREDVFFLGWKNNKEGIRDEYSLDTRYKIISKYQRKMGCTYKMEGIQEGSLLTRQKYCIVGSNTWDVRNRWKCINVKGRNTGGCTHQLEKRTSSIGKNTGVYSPDG